MKPSTRYKKSSSANWAWRRRHFLFLIIGILTAVLFGLVAERKMTPGSFAASPSVSGADYFGMNMMHLQWGNFSRAQVDAALADAKSAGVNWIRMDIQWSDAQPNGPGSWSWTGADKVVDSANAHGIKVLALLTYSPKWAIPAQYQNLSSKGEWEKYAPANVSDYAIFTGAAAAHFKPKGVHHYEIWNEANNGNFFKPAPNVVFYTQMLKASYTAIKAADSGAVVITSGLSPYGIYGQSTPANINPLNFLEGMYANGAKNYMNAIGWHPYSWDNGPPSGKAQWNAFYQMFGTSPSVVSIMNNNGDSKKIWMTEFGFPVGSDSPNSVTYNNEPLQAQYLTQGYNIATSSTWAGPLFWYNYQDETFGSSGESYGLKRADGSRRASWTAYQTASNNAKEAAATDTQPPTNVAVVIPKSNAIVSGSVLLDAAASDNKGVTKVMFYVDSQYVGNATSSGYGWILQSWNSTKVSDGNHTVFARAYDAAGNMKQSSAVTFRVKNSSGSSSSSGGGTPPTVPADSGSSTVPVSGDITLSAPISDPKDVSKIEYYVDGRPVCTTTPTDGTECKIDTSKMSNGEHTVTTKVFDKNGKAQTSNQEINVKNPVRLWQNWWFWTWPPLLAVIIFLWQFRKYFGLYLPLRFKH